ncbi:MAG: hypothetical protein KDD69_05825 [Bdellovibrionales bacterium]|nr:hypothetical protein [Bdellovibrionales bacterium]
MESDSSKSQSTHPGISAILLPALFVTALLTLPGLVELFRSGGASPRIFSDWDEPYYLPGLRKAGSIAVSSFLSFDDGVPTGYRELQTVIPHTLTDVVLGNLYAFLSLPPEWFITLLDLAFVPISFLLFTALFRALGAALRISQVGAAVLLVLPWLAYLPQYFQIPLDFPLTVERLSHRLYPCQPVLRGFYTQASYPLFALSLLLLVRAPTSRRPVLLYLGAGITGGLLIYTYFFAWGAFAAVAGLWLLRRVMVPERLSRRRYLLGSVLLFASDFIVALPALRLVVPKDLLNPSTTNINQAVAAGAASQAAANQPLSFHDFWYFGPELFLLAVALGALLWSGQRTLPSRPFLELGLIALLSEFVLLNLQPLLGIYLSPYHFPLFYLHPLLSGSLVCALLYAFRTQRLRTICTMLLYGAMTTVSIAKTYRMLHPPLFIEETTALIQRLREEPLYKRIAVVPFNSPFAPDAPALSARIVPYWIAALTDFHLVSDVFGRAPEVAAKRELLLGLLLTGRAQLLAPCFETEPGYKSFIGGTRDHVKRGRTNLCREAQRILSTANACDLLDDYGVDYLLWETEFELPLPTWLGTNEQSVWRSPEKSLELLRIRPSDLETLHQACDTQLERTP